MKKIIKVLLTGVLLMILILPAGAQQQRMIIDKIVAIVGDNTILESDVQMQYEQMRRQGGIPAGMASRCKILEDIMVQKLLYHHAKLDSLPLEAGEVERQLDARLQYFVQMVGSREALEQFYHKSYLEIQNDLRDDVREQVLASKEQNNIIQDVTITPGEVKAFYRKLPKDSIPMIPEQYEIQQIQITPPYSEEAKIAARQKLLDLRKRIIDGEHFSTLAILYSEDPGSARRGGELGYMGRAELDKDFARVAFSLKKDQVSPIVETRFGYHIIQLIDRKGDLVNVRHILVKPKLSADAIQRANTLLDSVARQIRIDSLSFEKAAFLFSEDEETRTTGGLVINPATGESRFDMSQLDKKTGQLVSRMKEGEISDPFQFVDNAGNTVFKIIRLKKIIPAHRANLQLDYELLANMAKQEKQKQVFSEWIREKLKTTYVRVDDEYRNCKFQYQGWLR
jgi:peptidyl-prolyl cis-trans isomerase SurA